MTPAEVAAKLRQFNEWRRGDYEPSEQPEPPNPYEVGLAIDAAVELLDRLEAAKAAWRESDKTCRDLTEKVIPNIRERLEAAEAEALEQARLNGMGSEREAALMAKMEAAEKDVTLKELVIDALGSELNVVAKERDALRAKIEAMEQQEPVTIVESWANGSYRRNYKLRWLRDVNEGAKLYLLPGAKGE